MNTLSHYLPLIILPIYILMAEIVFSKKEIDKFAFKLLLT